MAKTRLGIKGLVKLFVISLLVIYCAFGSGVSHAALSKDQHNALSEGVLYFNTEICDPAAADSTDVNLVGSGPQQQAYNFFVSRGLTPMQSAAIVGNLMWESSGLNPTIVNPTSGAYGIAQWLGDRLTKLKALPNYDKLNVQLGYLWNTDLPSQESSFHVLSRLKAATTIEQATFSWEDSFERAGEHMGDTAMNNRIKLAKNTLALYGGGAAASAGSTTASSACPGGGASGGGSCSTGTGVAKIYLCSLRYDPASYSESASGNHMGGGNPQWIKTICPAAGNPNGTIPTSCLLDCSGLVNIAVYDAFGYNLQENTNAERADEGKLWKVVPLSQAQRGDLVQPNQNHVEIIDHIQGGTIYTFAAHTSQVPQPDQVKPASYPASNGFLYLHWIGPTK